MRRVYPLPNRDLPLSEEQIAVVFAMTSRLPAPFNEIAEQVSEEMAIHRLPSTRLRTWR